MGLLFIMGLLFELVVETLLMWTPFGCVSGAFCATAGPFKLLGATCGGIAPLTGC